jgi:hypothetical protein
MASGLTANTTPASLGRSNTMFSVDRTRGVAGQAAEAFEESDEMDFETFCDFERRREGNQGLKYSILRERFAKIDIDGSGTVSRTEFEAGAILDALSQNDAMKLFAAIDTDGNYSIDRQEFTRAVRATKGCQAVANSSIILAFNALDQVRRWTPPKRRGEEERENTKTLKRPFASFVARCMQRAPNLSPLPAWPQRPSTVLTSARPLYSALPAPRAHAGRLGRSHLV